MPKLTVIESFCGAGGMSLGLLQSGYDVRLAFDINEMAVKTYNANIAPHCFVLDAAQVSGAYLLEKAGLKDGQLDVLTGGPPCQGFSKQKRGAHLLNDDRNRLVLHYARLVEETGAKSFIFENVEIFGQKRGKELIESIRERLYQYDIFTFFVCSSDFGLAQKRGRFLMMGIRKSCDSEVPVIAFSTIRRTVKDVLGHLPPPPDDYSEHPNYPNHIKCKITRLNEERFSHVPPGGGWQDIPFSIRLPCHQVADPSTGGWPDVYGRLRWDDQCPTLTAGFDSFTRGRFGHPEQHRSLTLHEGALLQGFPADFRFYGTRHDVRLQIGNAVPPPVARAAGEALARALFKKTTVSVRHQSPVEGGKQLAMAV
jgi:DNA (cytosine-5)-methyltransferase 1